MHKKSILLAATLLAGFASQPASATVYGVFSNASTTVESAALTIIRAAGDTASMLPNLKANSLVGINVLFLLNSSNTAALAALTNNTAAIKAFVQGGGVFALSDRQAVGATGVIGAADSVPGAASISFTHSLAQDINPGAASMLVNGPAGVIDQTTLDTKTSSDSDYGYATVSTLPVGATTLLTTTDATQAVAFSYKLGAGSVYYSTIPLDRYLGATSTSTSFNSPAFTTIYAPNLVAYLDTLAVPEPASLAMLGVGLLGLRMARRRAV